MKRYVVVWEYGSAIDFDPFPQIPAGAMFVEGTGYLIASTLDKLVESGFTDALVISDVGAVYLGEAAQKAEHYLEISTTYFSDLEKSGEARVLDHAILSSVVEASNPVLLVSGHSITDLDYEDVMHEQANKSARGQRKQLATVLAVPGENKTSLMLPPGYRPTNVVAFDITLLRLLNKRGRKVRSLEDLLSAAEVDDRLGYYLYDGVFLEIDTQDKVLSLKPPEL